MFAATRTTALGPRTSTRSNPADADRTLMLLEAPGLPGKSAQCSASAAPHIGPPEGLIVAVSPPTPSYLQCSSNSVKISRHPFGALGHVVCAAAGSISLMRTRPEVAATSSMMPRAAPVARTASCTRGCRPARSPKPSPIENQATACPRRTTPARLANPASCIRMSPAPQMATPTTERRRTTRPS